MYISVRVVAGAKAEKVERLTKGRLRIFVKEPAKQNLANKRVLTVLAKHLKLPTNKLRLISGTHTPAKLFSIEE